MAFSLIKFIFRYLRYILLLISFTLFGSLHIIALLIFGYKRGTSLNIPWIWGRLVCFFSGAKLHIKGLENIPEDGGVVFLFSHSSFLDIPVLLASYKGVVNFAAKSFVFKMPLMGVVGRLIKTIEIPDSREKAIEEYKKAEQRLKEGDKFMISPEGGRSSGEEILPFKSGPFIFALNSNANLVPILIYGAHKVWHKNDKLPNMKALFSHVHVTFFPVVEIKSFNDKNRKQKAEEIRQSMIEVLKNHQNNDSL